MRRLYIALLLAAISWSTPAGAQVVDSSNSLLDEVQDDSAETVKHGVAFNSWSLTTEVLLWWTKAAPCPVPLATTAPESALTNPRKSGQVRFNRRARGAKQSNTTAIRRSIFIDAGLRGRRSIRHRHHGAVCTHSHLFAQRVFRWDAIAVSGDSVQRPRQRCVSVTGNSLR